MLQRSQDPQFPTQQRTNIDEYREFVGNETIDRILGKAEPLKGKKLTHVNSTCSGVGVAELLSSLVLLMTRLLEGCWTCFWILKPASTPSNLRQKRNPFFSHRRMNLAARPRFAFYSIEKNHARIYDRASLDLLFRPSTRGEP